MNSKVICLANIEEATEQEIFDQVVAHHRKQRRPSLAPDGSCVYRSSEGLACFAGALIADDEYHPDFERCSAYNLAIFKQHFNFVQVLQGCHDAGREESLEEFQRNTEQRLEIIARQYSLVYSPEQGAAI